MSNESKTLSDLVEIIKGAIYELRSWGSVEGQEEMLEKTLEVLSGYPELRDGFAKDTE